MKRLAFLIALFLFSITSFAQSASDTLVATATSDPHFTIVSYTWKQTSGNALPVFSPSGNKLIFTATLAGNYTIDVTAMDSQGNSVTVTNYITVMPYNSTKPTMRVNPYSDQNNPIIIPLK
jgi:Tol biopolymer transport system component